MSSMSPPEGRTAPGEATSAGSVLLLALGLGVPLVLTDVWRATRAAQLIQENGATFCFAATPFLSDLVERGKRLGRLRLFATAGTTIPPAIVEAARSKLGIAVAASWGMTECISVTATAPDGSRADTSDGCALPNGEVRIVELDGHPFFLGTLFLPQMTSSRDEPHPVLVGLAQALSSTAPGGASPVSSGP